MGNLVIIPYHDWRKINSEGNRTRDAHFIETFRNNSDIGKLVIINRPVTFAEIFFKRKTLRIKGTTILNEKGCKLIAIDDKTFIVDIFLSQNISHLLLRRKWYFRAYQDIEVISFISKCLTKLNIVGNYYLLSQNILASHLIDQLHPNRTSFDAWDNFRLMPGLKSIHGLIDIAYTNYATKADLWYTNSVENIKYFKVHYNVEDISLLKNGVDFQRFNKPYAKPSDLKALKKPIVGFGGKITHLFDYELYNAIVRENPDFDFVIVGQILDKKVFNLIELNSNVHFLGDKHYDEYPSYVKNFDICIVPYVTGEKQHGQDSIKAYEYLAAGKKVVGTKGSGLQDLTEYLFIANTSEEFTKCFYSDITKKKFNGEEHSWFNKAKIIIKDFQK